MANNVGNLKVKLNLDSAAYEYGINQCVNSTKVLGQALGALGIGISAAKIVDIGKQALKASSDFEQAGVSFSVMLGDAKKAKRLVNDLQNMANVTPFETQDLLDASKTLLNFGISAKEVMPDLQMLGDIAGGDKQRLASLTLAFSQMSSAGRLMGQDLLQMINAGFNPLEEIARRTGKSIGYWKDEMSKGNVSVEMVRQAFMDATSEGGRFYKMMDKQSETLEGRLSTMNDAYVLLLRSISDGFVPALKDGAVVMTDVINQTTESISKFNDWAATNTQVVGGLTDMSIAIAALAAGIPLTNTAVVAIIASMRNFGTVTAKTTAFQIAFATYLKGDTALAMLQFRAAISATITQIRELTIRLMQCPLTWVVAVLGTGAAVWWAYQQNVKSTQRAIEDLNATQDQQVNKTSEAIQTLKELDGASNLNYEQTKRLDSAISYLTEKYPAYIDKLRNELRLKGEISKATAEQIANEMMLAKVKGLQEQKTKIDKKVNRAVQGYQRRQIINATRYGTPIKENTGRLGASKNLQKDQDRINAELEKVKKERQSIINELNSLNAKNVETKSSASSAGSSKKKTAKQLAAEEKRRQKEALDLKIALLEQEKYKTKKTDEEIYQLELAQINAKIAASKQGTSEHAQALAERYKLEQEHADKVRELELQKIIDKNEDDKRAISNADEILNIQYEADMLSKKKLLETELIHIREKKRIEQESLQAQLALIKGNTAEEIKLKRDSNKVIEELDKELLRKQIELQKQKRVSFKDFSKDIYQGWGDTVSGVIKGDIQMNQVFNQILDSMLDTFADYLGKQITLLLQNYVTLDNIQTLFGIKKAATDTAIISGNASVVSSQEAVGTSAILSAMQAETASALQVGANLAISESAGAAATTTATSAGIMTTASAGMAAGVTALVGPVMKLAGAFGMLAMSSAVCAITLPIIAISTTIIALSSALAALSLGFMNMSMMLTNATAMMFVPISVLLTAEFAIIAAAATVAAKAVGMLAVSLAAASAAAIPIVGWVLAPGAALSTAAAIAAGQALLEFREKGGPVKAGHPYIVGEKRPELFIPDRSGTILPDTSALNGGGGGTTNQYAITISMPITSTDAKSFEGRIDEMTGRIHSNLSKAIKGRKMSPLTK